MAQVQQEELTSAESFYAMPLRYLPNCTSHCAVNWFHPLLTVTPLVPALPNHPGPGFVASARCSPRALQGVWRPDSRQGFLKRELTFRETSLSLQILG